MIGIRFLFEQAGQPGMTETETAEHTEAMPELLPPVLMLAVELRGTDEMIGDGREKIAFAAEMIVERHRRDADRLGQPAHRQRCCAFPIDQSDGRRDQLVT